jgi:hypothetical protein
LSIAVVVTVPFGVELFVLARDVSTFKDKYERLVLAMLKLHGFDRPINAPVETYQGNDCAYAPIPTAATWLKA